MCTNSKHGSSAEFHLGRGNLVPIWSHAGAPGEMSRAMNQAGRKCLYEVYICDPTPRNESLCAFEKSEKKGKVKKKKIIF
jgi:hypothetical protein